MTAPGRLRSLTRDEAIGRALLETDHLGGMARKGPAIVAALEEAGYTVVPKAWRQAVERHHDVMANVVLSISEVEPRHIDVATSAGFYALRQWLVTGLLAAEGNFLTACLDTQDTDELDAEELHPSAPWNIAGMD